MEEIYKIQDQFSVGQYVVFKLDRDIEKDFNAFIVDGQRYIPVIVYGGSKYYAIKSKNKIIGKNVRCVI